tara:strand:- start:612 stop:722 length:111 start_codon:yes stop_codon:yes gene_type:complete
MASEPSQDDGYLEDFVEQKLDELLSAQYQKAYLAGA